ncbi:twin-arginine translocase TatA/TatE family subunit, partial [Priestia megaterium]|uniref:twin-arginine translocase TatA/TatE family subunit n=1 Tax=Priestia megaterium TaxID=1404 RepID=UPI002877DF4A
INMTLYLLSLFNFHIFIAFKGEDIMPGATSMVVIGITALIVFGPSKLPRHRTSIWTFLREFKNAAEGIITR